MGGFQLPGPICRFLDALEIDSGTLCRSASPTPGPQGVAAKKGHGAAAKKKSVAATPAVVVEHVLKDLDTYIGSTDYANVDGKYECAAFPQHKEVAAAPSTTSWKPGPHVEPGTTIARGTWVATFVDGKYQGHVGAFDSMDKDGNLTLIDQWKGRDQVDRTTYHVKKQPYEGKISNDPSKYYVVLW